MKTDRPTPGGNPDRSETEIALDWPRLWKALLERLATPHGREAAAAFGPLKNLAAVRRSLDTIEEMARLQEERGMLSFDGAEPLAHLLERAEKKGGLAVEELFAVYRTHMAARRVAEALRRAPGAPLLNGWAEGWRQEPALTDALGRALSADGTLNETAFPELGALRHEMNRRRDAIHAKLDRALRSRSLSQALQEKIYTLRGNRYVLPVKLDFRGQVPGIVHDVSASGATLFIEPQTVVEESNALVLAEKRIEAKTAEILAGLTAHVGAAAPALGENMTWLGRVDLIHAQAALALAYQGTKPKVEQQGEIELKGVANPLMLLEGERPVRNDLALGEREACMVISGANAGGKTVLLKSVGLCALLVVHGMPIPARRDSRCDLFRSVRADIGDRQNLSQSLSTFSAQVRFLAGTLEVAGPETLVLVDEMLTGTDPREGAALACTLLREFVSRGARCVVTTHYGEVKELAAGHPRMVNASVSFDLDTLSPTFHLVRGTPGISYAFPIARRHGMEETVVAEARRRMKGQPDSADSLLAELHRQERQLRERAAQLSRVEAGAASLQAQLEERAKVLTEKEWRVRQRERGTAGEELETARRRIAEVIQQLQGANSLPLAGKVRERLGETAAQVEEDFNSSGGAGPASLQPLDPGQLAVGDEVLIRSLERIATLAEILPKGRRARVNLGRLSMEVDMGELALPPPPLSRRAAKKAAGRAAPEGGQAPAIRGGAYGAADGSAEGTAGGGKPAFAFSTSENTIDVRGNRLSAALEKTEQFLDMCVMKHVSPVLLIHGHGTGRLKAGIREWLKESVYVAAFRPGGEGEGWDGVTVAALNL